MHAHAPCDALGVRLSVRPLSGRSGGRAWGYSEYSHRATSVLRRAAHAPSWDWAVALQVEPLRQARAEVRPNAVHARSARSCKCLYPLDSSILGQFLDTGPIPRPRMRALGRFPLPSDLSPSAAIVAALFGKSFFPRGFRGELQVAMPCGGTLRDPVPPCAVGASASSVTLVHRGIGNAHRRSRLPHSSCTASIAVEQCRLAARADRGRRHH
jgi:hypothetical protein